MIFVPYLVRNLPFQITRTSVTVQGHDVPIKADQIIVWGSLAHGGAGSLERGAPHFPAILDTGFTHNFSIREQQLIQWAGVDPRRLPKLGEIRLGKEHLPLLEANVWLHPNIPGRLELATCKPPLCLELDAGVAVYPRAMAAPPRLPLLGLRAMRQAGLRLNIDCRALSVTIRTSSRYWIV